MLTTIIVNMTKYTINIIIFPMLIDFLLVWLLIKLESRNIPITDTNIDYCIRKKKNIIEDIYTIMKFLFKSIQLHIDHKLSSFFDKYLHKGAMNVNINPIRDNINKGSILALQSKYLKY